MADEGGNNADTGSGHLGKNRLSTDDGLPEIAEGGDVGGGAGSGGAGSGGAGAGGTSAVVSGAALAAAAAGLMANPIVLDTPAALTAAGGNLPLVNTPPAPAPPATTASQPLVSPSVLAASLAGLSMSSAAPAVPSSTSSSSPPAMAAPTQAAAGSSSASAPAAGQFATAGQVAILQQDNANMLDRFTALQAMMEMFLQQQAAGRGAVAAPVVGPVAVMGGGQGASEADCERRAAKAEFESAAAGWRAGRLVWALREQRGTDGNKEIMTTIVAGHIAFNDKVYTQLKSMAGFNVLDFTPVGHPGQLSVADNLDLMCEAIMRMLKFGLRADVPADAKSMARLQPMEAAMLKARATFRMQLLNHHGDFADGASREVLADLPNADFRKFSNRLVAWMMPMCRLSTAPPSFEPFGAPPVPEFGGIHGFATTGSHLIRIFANRGGQGGRKRRAEAPAGGGGGGGAKRQQGEGVCFSFRDTGRCRFGKKCRFSHVQGAKASGAGGGGGSSNAGGGGSTGAGGGGGGSSSALVVLGGAGAGDP